LEKAFRIPKVPNRQKKKTPQNPLHHPRYRLGVISLTAEEKNMNTPRGKDSSVGFFSGVIFFFPHGMHLDRVQIPKNTHSAHTISTQHHLRHVSNKLESQTKDKMKIEKERVVTLPQSNGKNSCSSSCTSVVCTSIAKRLKPFLRNADDDNKIYKTTHSCEKKMER